MSAGAFRREDLGNCVLTDREGKLGLNELRTYNIYCPGRMTQADANALGRSLVTSASGGPTFQAAISDEFRRFDLVPAFEDAPHVFHYGCSIGEGQGVATHVRVRLRGTRPARVQEIAQSCRLVAKQIRIGWSLEYKCRTHFMSNESKEFIYDVAKAVLIKDRIVSERGSYFCVWPSTDIQCAPCSTSDKLVIRGQAYGGGARGCSSGDVRLVRAD